jgi:tRNA threonylcarbamoyladenosine biosynthesis protein TsaE
MRLTADALNRFGETLGRELRGREAPGGPGGPGGPVVVGLSGELGSGKTTLVQAICRGLGAHVVATSPTYALVHQYETPHGAPIYHVDCYRLKSPDDARDLGFEDMMRERAIVLIEWPERAGPWVPPLDRHFQLSYGGQTDIRELEEVR